MALIPEVYIDSVIAIGTKKDGEKSWIASGFLYGQYLEKLNEEQARYLVYVVTNRHVLDGLDSAILRFNPQEGQPAKEFPVRFCGDSPARRLYHPDPSIDLAAIRIRPGVLEQSSIQFSYVHSDTMVASRQVALDAGLSEGNFCFLLGFPLGLTGGERNYVICRHGNVARISDFLHDHSNDILIDCLSYPGNSGGPVFTKPELVSIQGTKRQKTSYLLGVVSRFLTYTDTAVSQQTGRPRVTFEENIGLTRIVPAHFLKEWFDALPEHEARTAGSEESATAE